MSCLCPSMTKGWLSKDPYKVLGAKVTEVVKVPKILTHALRSTFIKVNTDCCWILKIS